MAKKKLFSMAKAKKILAEKHPSLKGHALTIGKRSLIGFIAGGGTPRHLSKQ